MRHGGRGFASVSTLNQISGKLMGLGSSCEGEGEGDKPRTSFVGERWQTNLNVEQIAGGRVRVVLSCLRERQSRREGNECRK